MVRFRILYTDNFLHGTRSYLAPPGATMADVQHHIDRLAACGWSAWWEYAECP